MSKVILSFLVILSAAGARAGEPMQESDFLSRTRQLTLEGRRAGEGYWSFDDQRIVFQSERVAGNPFYQIFSLDFTTGETTQISPGQGKTTCPFFHPDGDKILYASTHLDPDALAKQAEEIEFRESGKERRYAWDYDVTFDLFAQDLASGENVRLTDALGYDAEASYSPDGKWIAFTSMRHGYVDGMSDEALKQRELDPSWFGEIYIMPAEGGEAKRLTDHPGYDGGPFFSPDGTRIIWRRFDEEGLIADIFTMDLDGGDVRRLTDFGCMSWAPYFHPSGEYVFFAANKEGFGNFEIYLVDAAGEKEPVRATWTDRFDGLPVPNHAGDKIAFTSSRKGGEGAQIFLANWNHENALRALAAAPPRTTQASESRR